MNEVLKSWQNKFEDFLSKVEFTDGSHGLGHFRRVWRLADRFSTNGEDKLVILAACYFHDFVSYPKNDSRRSLSSVHCAEKTRKILEKMEFPKNKLDNVTHCIEAHSFSANIETKTPEAKIVQDADRMESLGAIGLARTFYVAGQMGSELFHDSDPFAENRELDDKRYCLDHFETKLFKLPKSMKTLAGKQEAIRLQGLMTDYLDLLRAELN